MAMNLEWFLLIAVAFGAIVIFFLQGRLASIQKELRDAFRLMSLDVTETTKRSLIDETKRLLAEYQEGAKADLEHRHKAIDQTLKPVQESLAKLDTHQRDLEKKREGAYISLTKQIESMSDTEKALRFETAQLASALKSPTTRGSWGQLHLRRVVELAGLLNHCDFYEQKTVEGSGRISRPDLIVRLPGDRTLVIDAKTPLDAYLESMEGTHQRDKKLQEHAAALKRHMRDLASKEYWKQFESSPEYVILYLPAEAYFSAALQVDPTLIELGAEAQVIIATPTTLIAMLRTVAYSWKQEALSTSAKETARLGAELYERLLLLTEHFNKVGKNLNGAVDAYNQAVASLESRVLVSARRLREGHIEGKDKLAIELVDKMAVHSLSPEECL
jgi:DNA recombination protein RmuC